MLSRLTQIAGFVAANTAGGFIAPTSVDQGRLASDTLSPSSYHIGYRFLSSLRGETTGRQLVASRVIMIRPTLAPSRPSCLYEPARQFPNIHNCIPRSDESLQHLCTRPERECSKPRHDNVERSSALPRPSVRPEHFCLCFQLWRQAAATDPAEPTTMAPSQGLSSGEVSAPIESQCVVALDKD
jgi:hypothetical protein